MYLNYKFENFKRRDKLTQRRFEGRIILKLIIDKKVLKI